MKDLERNRGYVFRNDVDFRENLERYINSINYCDIERIVGTNQEEKTMSEKESKIEEIKQPLDLQLKIRNMISRMKKKELNQPVTHSLGPLYEFQGFTKEEWLDELIKEGKSYLRLSELNKEQMEQRTKNFLRAGKFSDGDIKEMTNQVIKSLYPSK